MKLFGRTRMCSTDLPTSRSGRFSCYSFPCRASEAIPFPPAELVNVISTENANLLKTVKGIGLKTAQRVIVDLKDKIKTMGATVAGGSASAGMLLQSASVEVQEEAVAALTMLGFAAAPSQKVVLAILKEMLRWRK